MSKDVTNRGESAGEQFAQLVKQLSDDEFEKLWQQGVFDSILTSILDPAEGEHYKTVAEFLLKKKTRFAFIAALHNELRRSYSFRVEIGDQVRYISPTDRQWFNDAVMFTEGLQPFEGFLCKFDGTRQTFAVAARTVNAGSEMGPDDFEFVSTEIAQKKVLELRSQSDFERQAPLNRLRQLLQEKNNDESEYQELLEMHPWALGLKWKQFKRHEKLDDRNIPDFTGIRVDRECHDIFEIKPPFMPLFNRKGSPSKSFLEAWDQCERYIDFAQRDSDYLRRRGLEFSNPRCYLVAGLGLSPSQLDVLRRKERMNQAIEFLTYDDLTAFVSKTIEFVDANVPKIPTRNENSGGSIAKLQGKREFRNERPVSLWGKLSPEDWLRRTDDWVESHRDWPVLPPEANSRESIYEERVDALLGGHQHPLEVEQSEGSK